MSTSAVEQRIGLGHVTYGDTMRDGRASRDDRGMGAAGARRRLRGRATGSRSSERLEAARCTYASPRRSRFSLPVALALDPVHGDMRTWFVIALVFSLLGDIFLMLPSDKFVFGLGAFLLGHVAYTVGLNLHTEGLWLLRHPDPDHRGARSRYGSSGGSGARVRMPSSHR